MEERRRDAAPFCGSFQSLCPCLGPSGGGFMVLVPVLTWRSGSPDFFWHIRPDVRGLGPFISIFAIPDGDASERCHERHLAQHSSWVLDEPIPRFDFVDQRESALYQLHRQPCAVSLGRRVVIPVPSDDGDGEPLAGRRGPEDVDRMTSPCETAHVTDGIRLEARIKFDREGGVTSLSCDLAEALGAGEEFDGVHTCGLSGSLSERSLSTCACEAMVRALSAKISSLR